MDTLERRVTKDKYGCEWMHVIGADGAVSFHGYDYSLDGRRVAGLELHCKRQPTYMRERPPDFDNCSVLQGPCWCDGTTMYAMDFLLPMYDALGQEKFWTVLEQEYRRRFDPREISFRGEGGGSRD